MQLVRVKKHTASRCHFVQVMRLLTRRFWDLKRSRADSSNLPQLLAACVLTLIPTEPVWKLEKETAWPKEGVLLMPRKGNKKCCFVKSDGRTKRTSTPKIGRGRVTHAVNVTLSLAKHNPPWPHPQNTTEMPQPHLVFFPPWALLAELCMHGTWPQTHHKWRSTVLLWVCVLYAKVANEQMDRWRGCKS